MKANIQGKNVSSFFDLGYVPATSKQVSIRIRILDKPVVFIVLKEENVVIGKPRRPDCAHLFL